MNRIRDTFTKEKLLAFPIFPEKKLVPLNPLGYH